MLITRYLFKTLAAVTFFVAITLTSVIWLTQSMRFLELIVNSGAPAGIFMQLVFLSLPKFLEVILPLALLTAIIFIYNKLISDNELIILRACGFNQAKLAQPALILSGFLMAFLLLLSMWMSPYAHAKMQHLRQVIKAEYSSFLIQEGVFNNFGNMTVYASKQDRDGGLHGLLLHDHRDKSVPPITIMAERGRIIMAEDGPNVIVYDGSRQQRNAQNGTLTRLNFDEYLIKITDYQRKVRLRWKKADERSLSELLNPDLSDKRNVASQDAFRAEIHKRIIMPINTFSLSFIALVCLLFGPFNRRGQTKRILTAVMIVIIFQGLSLSLTSLATKHWFFIITMYLTAFLPIILGFTLLSPQGENMRHRLRKFLNKGAAS